MDENNIKTNSLKAWFLASRPKTLIGAIVPVAIGVSLAFNQTGIELFSFTPAILCLLFASIMQIDANFINDYFDYESIMAQTSTEMTLDTIDLSALLD